MTFVGTHFVLSCVPALLITTEDKRRVVGHVISRTDSITLQMASDLAKTGQFLGREERKRVDGFRLTMAKLAWMFAVLAAGVAGGAAEYQCSGAALWNSTCFGNPDGRIFEGTAPSADACCRHCAATSGCALRPPLRPAPDFHGRTPSRAPPTPVVLPCAPTPKRCASLRGLVIKHVRSDANLSHDEKTQVALWHPRLTLRWRAHLTPCDPTRLRLCTSHASHLR